MIAFITWISYVFCSFGLMELLLYFDGPFSILSGFRRLMHAISPKLGQLFTCPACCSSWIGIVFSTFNYLCISIPFTPFNIVFHGTHLWWLIIPLDCFFTAGTTWLLYVIDEYLEKNNIEFED